MQNGKIYNLEDLYDINDIILKAKDRFRISNGYQLNRSAVQRFLQIHLKNQNINKSCILGKKSANTNYFTNEIINELFSNKDVIRYFERIANKAQNYKTNSELYQERMDEIKSSRVETKQLLKELELTEHDVLFLVNDTNKDHLYLNMDELQFLKKKGIVKIANLTMDEKEMLQLYYKAKEADRIETQKIEETFKYKKLEIMISALFNEKYTLNEELLLDDITNKIRGGEHDTIFYAREIDEKILNNKELSDKQILESAGDPYLVNDNMEKISVEDLEQPITRSNKRLKDNTNYYFEKNQQI